DLGCDDGSICFPYDNFDGFLTYTSDPINVPVPSGVVEMPMTMNLRPASAQEGDRCGGAGNNCFVGRIESSNALQYAGNPEISVTLLEDPRSCENQTSEAGCVVFLDDLNADITVGARYNTSSEDVSCNGLPGLEMVEQPWLVTGFKGRSELDSDTGRRYSYSCRDIDSPLPGANPMPDGRVRRRHLELIDGALINGSMMIIIFRERMESILTDNPEDSIDGYGYMVLRRSEAELDLEDYEGVVPELRNGEKQLRSIACTDELLSQMNHTRTTLAQNADDVAQAILEGVTSNVSSLSLLGNNEAVHYLCVDTGLFDGGPTDNRVGDNIERQPCPVGSRVKFFTLDTNSAQRPLLSQCGSLNTQNCHQAWLAGLDCQQNGTCAEQLTTWENNANYGVQLDPYYRCLDEDRVYCNEDRLNLRNGKNFYAPNGEAEIVARPIRTDVADAFRYRTRFVNRSGANVGFVPEICIQGTELVPYCYDPETIESIRDRVECAMELYTDFYDNLSEPKQVALWEYLDENFSYVEEVNVFNEVQVRRGFEFLDMELLIMLGDESYTKALSSRFDLAQLNVASFEGSLFEEGGIDISGVAGAEMYNLYQAVQYYQMGLDRFYDISPIIAASVEAARQPGGPPSFITAAAVESYFGRLIRASTQKSKAWAAIAERYQNFNRPDLARTAIERAYTAAYLESVVLTNMMLDIVEITTPEEIDQIKRLIETAQRSYRVALLEMRTFYIDISDDLNYFGYAPDYIPFPALEHYRDACVEVAIQRARARIDLAQTAEQQALEADRSFNTDAASFQNELTRIKNTYNGQLAELCGTFDADGQIYPAIAKYAYLTPETQRVGDPCGLVGTGQIHSAYGQVDVLLTEMRRVRQSMVNTLEEARIEEERWNASCDVTNAFALMEYQTTGQINNIQHKIDVTRSAIAGVDRTLQDLSTLAMLGNCSVVVGLVSGGSCPSALVASLAYTAAFAVYEVGRIALDIKLNNMEAEVRDLQREIDLERSLMSKAIRPTSYTAKAAV
ncbi:MAG: hypothetical protein AAFS10_10375, partial [Myxococcota bacterium]